MDPFELDKDLQISGHEEGYYHEYCRLYLANIALTNQVKDLIDQKHQLANRLSKYEDQECASQSERNTEKNKRLRRNADEIQRYYKCTIKSCAKSYGSEGSLNQHYKLKHPQIYVTLPNVQSNSTQNDRVKEEWQEEGKDKENKRKFSNIKTK